MNRFFCVTEPGVENVVECGLELISQNYDQLPEGKENSSLMLFIDREKRQFFFTDARGMQVCKNLTMHLHKCVIKETTLKAIKQWQQSKPAKAQIA